MPRVWRQRGERVRLGEYLLDYDQERVLKTDLDLPVEGQTLSQDLRIQLINGVSGGGKTLILLYRLRLLHTSFPAKRFLVLTHNSPLIKEIESRFEMLHPSRTDRIRWLTFSKLCYSLWHPSTQTWQRPLSIARREKLIHAVWKEQLEDTKITERMFADELGWFKDNGLSRRLEYLDADRRGRGFRLTEEQRERIFGAMQAYQDQLLRKSELDWWDVPRRLWHWMEEGTVHPTPYDVVMVDEAQFFAPVWFQIVQRMVRPGMGYLFLAADPTQGFLRRGESWKSVAGLEVRGRTHYLRQSYRTTKAILRCAWTFYRERMQDDAEDLALPEWSGMQEGPAPLLVQFDTSQDERAWIADEIAQWVADGIPLDQLLVLHESWQGMDALLNLLNRRLGQGSARDPKTAGKGEWVRVTTINAGTGLESPIVFVAGISSLLEREEGLLLTSEDRADLTRENTHKLYMALTRAAQRLVVTYVGDRLPECLRRLLEQGLLQAE